MSVKAIVAMSHYTKQQGGMVTATQAKAVGVTQEDLHRLVRAGALDHVAHGVYKLLAAPWSQNDEIRAGWLQMEPGPLEPTERRAVVSHETAAAVYGIGDLFPPALQYTLPTKRRIRRQDVRLYVDEIPGEDTAWVDDMRVARPWRIIADLFADGIRDLQHLASIAVDAFHEGKLTTRELITACTPFAVCYGLEAGDGRSLAEHMWQTYTGQDLPAERVAGQTVSRRQWEKRTLSLIA